MQAIILAAGEGKRMWPLSTPKPLLRVANVALVQRLVSQLSEAGVTSFVFVCSPRAVDLLKQLFPKAVFVVQQSPKGTGDALLTAAEHVQHEFFVVNGDEWFAENPFPHFRGQGMAISLVSDVTRFGAVRLEQERVVAIEEKPSTVREGWVNAGAYRLTADIIADLRHLKPSARGEIELVAALPFPLQAVKASWVPLSYPWDILTAQEQAMKMLVPSQQGTVEKGVVLKGAVSIGKDTVVKAGAYIEGPVMIGERCTIGPNCYIRPSTVIGNDCKVGNAVEIKNSVLGDHVAVSHLSYLGDCVVGNNVNCGAGTIAANLRHDNATVQVKTNGKKIDTLRRKLGCIIADGVHTGVHTSIYPGRILTENTLPGQIVR